MSLLGGAFRTMPPALALSLADPKLTFSDLETQKSVGEGVSLARLDGMLLDPHDLKRLQV